MLGRRWSELPAFGPKPGAAPVRLHELDGLRGWAALSVVGYHIFWEIFAALAPGFHNVATGFILDGQLAVAVFFVLSGEALSAPYFAGKGDAAIHRLAIKRYPRLVIPILAVCLIVYGICHAGLAFNQPAGDVIGRPDWLGAWLKSPPSIGDVLTYAFAMVFITNEPTAITPFLATMMLELKVSFFVLFLLLAFKHLSDPRLVLWGLFIALMLLPPTRHIACFFAGVIFADIRCSGGFSAAQKSRWNGLTWVVIAAIGLLDGWLHVSHQHSDFSALFAVILLAAVYCNRRAVKAFTTPLSLWLGKISFPLFLIQFPVIITFTCWAIVRADASGSLDLPMMWIIGISSLGLCLVAAVLFEPIETLTKWFGNRLVAATDRLWTLRHAASASSTRG